MRPPHRPAPDGAAAAEREAHLGVGGDAVVGARHITEVARDDVVRADDERIAVALIVAAETGRPRGPT